MKGQEAIGWVNGPRGVATSAPHTLFIIARGNSRKAGIMASPAFIMLFNVCKYPQQGRGGRKERYGSGRSNHWGEEGTANRTGTAAATAHRTGEAGPGKRSWAGKAGILDRNYYCCSEV